MKDKTIYISDEELLHQFCTSGDVAFFGELYTRYIPMIYGVALKFFKNSRDAERVTTQLFTHLQETTKGTEITDFKPWLYAQLRQYCTEQLREKSGNSPIYDSIKDEKFKAYFKESEKIDYKSPDTLRCIAVLPDKQRSVVERLLVDGLTYREIAATTGFSLLLVKRRAFEGYQNLRECLNKKKNQEGT